MELAYAPQFGSAKDPVNMAGFVAAGLLRNDHPQLDVETIVAMPATEQPFLLDVRTPQEFAASHIPDAINIPVDDLRARLGEIPRDSPIAAYCQVGQRGYLATRISLERQVRIAAGSLVLVGAALALFVHPAFIGLSAFIGAGLVFAGITDTCGMGMILARMPWNQCVPTPTTACAAAGAKSSIS